MSENHQGLEMPNQTIFDQRMDAMSDELRELRSAITDVAKALTKLTILEERNATSNIAIEKIAHRQDKVEEKVAHLELEQVKFESRASGIATTVKIMWGALGGGVLFLGAEAIKQFAK